MYTTNTEFSTKNTAQIRLEVLQAALAHTDSVWYAQLDLNRVAAGEGKPYDLPEDKRIREALKLAKKLYAFVEPDVTTESETDTTE